MDKLSKTTSNKEICFSSKLKFNSVFVKLVLCSIFWFACANEDEKKSYEAEEQKTISKEEIKNEKIEKFANENNIIYRWDTMNLDYTLLYDPVMKSDLQIIDSPIVFNISRNNNSYNVRLICGFVRQFYFDVKTDNLELVNHLLKTSKGFSINSDDLFIVKIYELQKFPYILNIPDENEEKVELSTKNDYTDYLGVLGDFYGKGELIRIEKL